jgi:diguanylate cyclase (GGDEF)-like protein
MSIDNGLVEQYNLLERNENHIKYFVTLLDVNFRKDISESKKIIDRILEIAEKNHYQLAKAWAHFYLGWYYHDTCSYNNAIKNHKIAKAIFSNLNNLKGTIFTYNALMADYIKIGKYDIAIEIGLKGIKMGQENSNNELILSLLLNIIICYIELGLYNEARESINYFELLSFTMTVEEHILLSFSKAELELNDGNIDKAMDYIDEAYNYVINSEGKILLDNVLYIRGRIYMEKGQFDSAEKDFRLALDLAQKRYSMDIVSHILKEWGKLLIFKDQINDAKKKILEALNISKKINYKIIIGDIYKILSEVYKKEGDYKSAIEALELYHKYDKELFNKQSNLWLIKLQDNQIKREAETYKSLYKEIALISSIGKKITSDLNMTKVLKSLYDEVKKIINLDVLGILLYKEEYGTVDCSYFMEDGKKINVGEISINDENSYITYCIRNKESIIINDDEKEYVKYIPNRIFKQKSNCTLPKSLIYCPLIVGDKVNGVLSIQCYKRNMYSLDDLNKVKILASYLAIAIENSRLFKEVEFFATHDYLTGCLNRKVILEKGEKAFYRLNRYGEKFSIIMGDVDNFKTINDNFGHLVGDKVLSTVANTIKRNIRTSDYVGRYGGEEFLIILPHTDVVGAASLAERIRSEIASIDIDINCNEILNISISLGLFQFEERMESFELGIAAADKALYKSKRLGKNKVEIYSYTDNTTI